MRDTLFDTTEVFTSEHCFEFRKGLQAEEDTDKIDRRSEDLPPEVPVDPRLDQR